MNKRKEWKTKTWGSIATLEYGKPLRGYQNNTNGNPVFGTNGKIGYTDKILSYGEGVIIGRKGAYRGVHYSSVPFFVIDTAFFLKQRENFFMKWAYYALKCYNINDLDSGSAIPSTSREDFYNLYVEIPPISEQKAIAGVLSNLDNKIDLLQRQNATMEALAEILFRQWFIEEAQEDWEEKTIGDVVEIRGGGTPSTKEPSYWNGNIFWTSPRDLAGLKSIFLSSTERKITSQGLSKISSGLLPAGTLLLSSRAPIGYLAIAGIDVAINQGYIAILNNNIISNYYMYLWCKYYMEEIKAASNGSVFQEISKSVFKTLPFILPPEVILKEFYKKIDPIFKKINANQKQIRTLEKLRDTLLPKLMSGELRVRVDE